MGEGWAHTGLERRPVAFGASLRALRLRAGLSQKQLADFSTLSVRAIRDLEAGRVRSPRRDTLRLLEKALNLGPDRGDSLTAGLSSASSSGLGPFLGAWPVRPPVANGTLIGRSRELDTLMHLFGAEQRRLLAVTGIEGVGKTRLALEFARALHIRHESSILWVSLSDEVRPWGKQTAEAALLSARIRELIHAGPEGARRIGELIGDRSTLIALDGLRTTGASADVIAQLLAECPGLRMLITTRNPAGLAAESLFPLAPLPVPDAAHGMEPARAEEVASVRMLLMQMKQVRPAFELSAGTVATVVRICGALDGLPGALEHGARWSLVYSPQELARQLEADPLLVATPPAGGEWGTPRLFESVRRAVLSLTRRQRRLLSVMGRRPGQWSIAEVSASTGLGTADVMDDMYMLLMRGLIRRRDEADQSLFELLNIVRHLHGAAGKGLV